MSVAVLAVAAQIAAGGSVVGIWTHENAVPGGQPLGEVRAVQPVAFASAAAFAGRLRAHVMLNFEAWTLPGGQLANGNFGEGFNDRRHPHTWSHELIAAAVDPVRLPGGLRWSVSAGKGFAPFGTDDPMNRPALIYPVNHHWGQILERAVVIAAVAAGPVMLEGGLFNGDEPEHPRQWPDLGRFGDSWSLRALVHPAEPLELQASHASVKSPEHRPGAGLTHAKTSVSARYHRTRPGGADYALAEWAYNSEESFFIYRSFLAEAQLTRGRHRPYARFEHTERPEETRSTDLFRSPRPHFENSTEGTSVWDVVTAGYGLSLSFRRVPARFELIAEGSLQKVTEQGGGVFDPLTIWGRNDLWMLSVGVRIAAGTPLHRMGRYGVAASDGPHTRHQPGY